MILRMNILNPKPRTRFRVSGAGFRVSGAGLRDFGRFGRFGGFGV